MTGTINISADYAEYEQPQNAPQGKATSRAIYCHSYPAPTGADYAEYQVLGITARGSGSAKKVVPQTLLQLFPALKLQPLIKESKK